MQIQIHDALGTLELGLRPHRLWYRDNQTTPYSRLTWFRVDVCDGGIAVAIFSANQATRQNISRRIRKGYRAIYQASGAVIAVHAFVRCLEAVPRLGAISRHEISTAVNPKAAWVLRHMFETHPEVVLRQLPHD